jgi:hypothetical protein
VAEVPLVGYRDVLMPLEKPTHNKLDTSVPLGAKFAVFAFEVNDPKNFGIYGVRIQRNWFNYYCIYLILK